MANITTSITLAIVGSGGNISGQNIYGSETISVTVTTPAGHGSWTASEFSSAISLSPSSGASGSTCVITAHASNTGSFSASFLSSSSSGEVTATGAVSGSVLASVNGTVPSGITLSYQSDGEVVGRHIKALASGGTGTLQVSGDNVTWQTNGFWFYRNRGSSPVFYARSLGIGSGATPSASLGPVANGQVPYLPPSTASGSLGGPYNVLFSHGTTYTFPSPGVPTGHNFSISFNTINSTTVPLPAAAGTYTFSLYTKRQVAYGGDNSTWSSGYASTTVTRAAEPTTVSPPTSITFNPSNTLSATTNVVLTASGGTAGGTLNVGISDYAASPRTLSLTRGTTYTASAYRELGGTNSSTISQSYTVPYLPNSFGDLSIGTTVSNTTITSTTTTQTAVVTNGNANTQYRLIKNGTWISTHNYGSTPFQIPTAHLPTAGNTQVYSVEGRLLVSSGGDGTTWSSTGHTFSITHTSATSGPNAFDLGSDGVGVPLSTLIYSDLTPTITGMVSPTSHTVTASGAGSPEVSVAGGAYATSATVTNNQTVSLRFSSSNTYNTANTATLTINGVSDSVTATTMVDPGTGGSTGTTGSNAYGLEVRNSSGTVIFGPDFRSGRAINSGTWSAAANSSSISYTVEGMTASNRDTIGVLLAVTTAGAAAAGFSLTIQYGAGSFYIQNNSSTAYTGNFLALRY